MSITYTADVFCDGCNDWTSGIASGNHEGLVRPARQVAHRAGWITKKTASGYVDLCPRCQRQVTINPEQGVPHD